MDWDVCILCRGGITVTVAVPMKAANISVKQIHTSLRTGQCILLATYHATLQSNKPIHLPVYTNLAHKVSPQRMHPHTMTELVVFFLV